MNIVMNIIVLHYGCFTFLKFIKKRKSGPIDMGAHQLKDTITYTYLSIIQVFPKPYFGLKKRSSNYFCFFPCQPGRGQLIGSAHVHHSSEWSITVAGEAAT